MATLNLRHILAPIDFSPLSSVVLRTASAIARARRADLRTLYVSPSEGASAPEGLGSLDHQALMSRLRASLMEAAPSYDLVGAAVRQGDPGTQILHFARTLPADVIVAGGPRADRPERPIGPVVPVVVARSECPVLTVPSAQLTSVNESGLFANIVCAVDLAPSSGSVIQQALSLAWETAGRLTYVCVVPEGGSSLVAESRARLLEAIPAEANSWSETDALVVEGDASVEILRVAAQRHADLVVIGAPRRWTSTAHAILSGSMCPVLVTHDARPLPRPAFPE
jgi:nucleotide-binding universal stress UspA family protein